jgi:hypothetical protein
MSKNIFKTALFLSVTFFLASCNDDEPEVINEEEEFSRVTVKVTNENDATDEQTYTFEVEGHDHDHAGVTVSSEGSHEEHTHIELNANSSYLFEIRFYNDEDPDNIEDVTLEVIEEADEHLVFYEVIGQANITIETAGPGVDTIDSNSKPVHLVTRWTTADAEEVEVMAYLIHQPTTKDGNTRDDFGGGTDVEIEFEAHVE